MLSVNGAWWSTAASGPSRDSLAQSTATRTRSDASSGTSRSRPSSRMKRYSPGIGAGPARNIALSLPSCRSASCVAASDPRASPSGFSCVVTRKRSRSRTTSAIALRSASVVVWCCCVIRGMGVGGRRELVDQLRHAYALLDRGIVFERKQRSPLEMQLTRHPRLQHAVSSRQPGQAALALPLTAEHAHVDARVAQVRRRLHAGDGHEPDAGVLELEQRL